MEKRKNQHEPEATVDEVVAFCREHKLNAEIVGNWVWVSFDDTPPEDVRKLLRDFGFRWSARRRKWAHSCGTPSRPSKKGDPWKKYAVHPVGQVA